MKRFPAILLSIALIASLIACGSTTYHLPGTFYYISVEPDYESQDGVLAPETREIQGMENNPDAMMDAYFAGPESNNLASPFPRDTRVLRWEMDDGVLKLTMNEAFAQLSGVELSLACACATRTFLGLLPIEAVSFQVEDGLLGGEKSILMSNENIRVHDDSLNESRAEFTIFYADPQRRYLISQEITVNLAMESDVISCLLEELTTPPEGSNLLSPLPGNTKVLGYTVDDGICTMDFSAEFERNGFSRVEAQRLALLSVVNTLSQLEEIHQVEFSVEGNLLLQYGLLTVSGPLSPDENAIGPVRTGMNEFDASLYLSNGSEPYLALVPTRLRQGAGMSQEELVVRSLLEFQPVNGFYSSIPQGTTLESIQLRNGVCFIDLSGAFLESTDHLTRSVHSIVASVCALDGVNSAQITVDGETPQGDYDGLFGVLSPKADWYL